MKRIFKIFIVALIFVALLPIRVDAAKTKYIIKADVVYEIYPKEKITLYVDTTKKITWSTSNKKIATVSSKGVVTGKKPGNTTITATVGKKKYKCKVQVWSRESEIVYENDIAPADPVDRYASTSIDPTEKTKSTKDLDGIENTISGKLPQADNSTEADELITSDKTPEWADEYYLKNVYDYSAYRTNKLYIIRGVNDSCVIDYSITGKLEIGKIYEGTYNSFTIRFKFDSSYELSFYYTDLKDAGIIK